MKKTPILQIDIDKYSLVGISPGDLVGSASKVQYRCSSCQAIKPITFCAAKQKYKLYQSVRCGQCANRDQKPWFTESDLKAINATDTTPRALSRKDLIQVYCSVCSRVYEKTVVGAKYGTVCPICANSGGKLYSTEELQSLGLVVCTPREILTRDRVDVFCGKCNEINNVQLSGLFKKRHSKNPEYCRYFCPKCKHIQVDVSAATEKAKKTNLERRGVEYASQCIEVKDKEAAAWLETFRTRKEINLRSSGELELLGWLRNFYPDCGKAHIDQNEFDIVSESKKIAIEYNGLYWHSESRGKDRNYHKNKMVVANNSGFLLINILESEWLQRKNQVKSRLLSIFGLNQHRVYARQMDMDIQHIKTDEVIDFIDKYHIQPPPNNYSLSIALRKPDGELIAAAIFGNHHRDSRKITLSRFVTKENYTVIGGLSKIGKAASQILERDIISWCDLRWSNGNGYLKAGWVLDGQLPPDYSYTNFRKVFSKQSRQKRLVKTPNGMTELEHANQDGLHRIWDCGKLRFVYPYTPPTDKK